MRLDLFLVQQKLAASRTQAQELIKNGHVILKQNQKEMILLKPNYEVSEINQKFISIQGNNLQKYVSRGGLKLEAALRQKKIDLKEKIVLDVGQSTGGFTDCLLQHQAKFVVGIDVGQDQLHISMRQHPQVTFFESLHVNELHLHAEFLKKVPSEGFDLIVADVSFISLTKVMPHLSRFLKKNGHYLFLVKPQFEAGPNALDKNGIVKDEKSYSVVQNEVTSSAFQIFGNVQDYFKSDLQGKDGNQEFFIYGQKQT